MIYLVYLLSVKLWRFASFIYAFADATTNIDIFSVWTLNFSKANFSFQLSSKVMTSQKWFFEIIGFIQLFGTTYLKNVHTDKIGSLLH